MIIKTKRGAIELSINTIVIIVLAMSMLILGLVLILLSVTAVTLLKMQKDNLAYNLEQYRCLDSDPDNFINVKGKAYLVNGWGNVKNSHPDSCSGVTLSQWDCDNLGNKVLEEPADTTNCKEVHKGYGKCTGGKCVRTK